MQASNGLICSDELITIWHFPVDSKGQRMRHGLCSLLRYAFLGSEHFTFEACKHGVAICDVQTGSYAMLGVLNLKRAVADLTGRLILAKIKAHAKMLHDNHHNSSSQ